MTPTTDTNEPGIRRTAPDLQNLDVQVRDVARQSGCALQARDHRHRGCPTAGDHLGTTHHASGRTTRMWIYRSLPHRDRSDRRKRLVWSYVLRVKRFSARWPVARGRRQRAARWISRTLGFAGHAGAGKRSRPIQRESTATRPYRGELAGTSRDVVTPVTWPGAGEMHSCPVFHTQEFPSGQDPGMGRGRGLSALSTCPAAR